MCLYKRVQILIADIWSCFEGDGLGHFYDINKLTMFADYRVPQALLALGVMTYSNDLAGELSQQVCNIVMINLKNDNH